MDIRLVSSFTDDDEDRFAPVLLKTMASLLSKIPIAYSVRMETTRGTTFQRTRTTPEPAWTFTQPDGTDPEK